MREILVIGIGAGNPEHVTMQAVNALNAAEVFFVVDKGEEKGGLRALRDEILGRYMRTPDYRVVPIPETPRESQPAAYTGAVGDWHERRADLFEAAIRTELDADGRGAFLVWGDPALYDSTQRILDQILARGRVEFEYRIIPGISSVQALATAHRIPLNRIGEPVHVTPGRRLAEALALGLDSVIVMLDGGFAAAELDDPDLHVYWGAYLGSPDEELRSGPLREVTADILATKRALRDRHGWIMDTYLLRRERP